MIYALLERENLNNRTIYTLRNIFTLLGYKYKIISTEKLSQFNCPNKKSISIYFGKNLNRFIWCDLTVPLGDYNKWLDSSPLVTLLDNIPILYIGEKPQFLIKDNILGFDFLNPIFFLLSRQEEYLINQRDQWGRFAAHQSCLSKHELINKPIIGYYIKYMRLFLRGVIQKKNLPLESLDTWKKGKSFAVALTHDVDFLNFYNLGYGIKLIKNSLKNGLSGFLGGLRHTLGGLSRNLLGFRDPLWTLEQLMLLEDSFGLRSTFFFSAHVKEPNLNDPFYKMEDKILFRNRRYKINEMLKYMEREGWEVGLHGSMDSLYEDNLFMKEKEYLAKILNKDKLGNRQHFLRFDIISSWAVFEQADLLYDSSLGYIDRLGYRAGTGYPFFAYDLMADRPSNVLEFPLIFIEGTLEAQNDMNEEKAFEICMHYINEAEATGEMINILWHTHNLHRKRCNVDWNLVYQKVLEELNKKDAWIAPLGEIAQWWLSKNRILSNKSN